MRPIEYIKMRAVEDRYWWYQGLRDLTAKTVSAFLERDSERVVLDAGCGTGGMIQRLRSEIPGIRILGLDANPLALQLTRERCLDLPLAQASVSALPFRDESFDLVICLDVLYTEGLDDDKALNEFFRILKKGGSLVLNVPAFPALEGEHDRAVQGGRRYVKNGFSRMIEKTGFVPQAFFYWNNALFPILLLWRTVTRFWGSKKEPRSELAPLPFYVNHFLVSYLRWEIQIAERFPIPFGSSLFGTVRKPV